MTAKIVVVGSFNMDLTSYMERLPRLGETIHGRHFQTGPGGKGSNQAIAAARLNADVTFVGRIGTDIFGDSAVAQWGKDGINTRYVLRDAEVPTGVAPIWVEDSTGRNAIVIASGANLKLTPEDVEASAEAVARADVLVTQLEISLDSAAYALKLAKQSGVRTILNPAPAAALPDDIIALADIITPNETELEVLSRLSGSDVESAARMLLKRDDQVIIVTLGEQGAQVVTKTGSVQIPAFPVQAVDTTGAGDCFTGALAVALAEAQPMNEAVRFANAAAALCVTKPGTAASMPTRAEVEALRK
ncbi:MAG: ribokinase [Pleurocapsa minor GSE-CHR-MK-17-07R]|jgi:ribokinase|nr:ribokinase [Pleurocapsa minor GSE-CHR-MK 17-07R]